MIDDEMAEALRHPDGPVSPELFERLLRAATTPEQLEEWRSLRRWFMKHYPTPLERNAYVDAEMKRIAQLRATARKVE